ncbi:hypothetical protein [Lysinibacillus capsici]|uniref:hypothetical protein n=1 Tax=Lysinibacillus capsici TaxID=2115968 RepID=UPI001CD94648|nr:hypothetical protein [Lysinibacillus capsici]
MTSIAYKQKIAKEHINIIKIIHHLGKGVMWRTQLKQYLKYFYHLKEKQIATAIATLKDADIIHIHRYCNRQVLRLKKFGIYFLSAQSRENTASIKFTTTKALKSAFINAILLYNLNQRELDMDIDEYIEMIKSYTTLLAKDKSNHHILKPLLQNPFYKNGWEKIRLELELLEEIRQNNINRLNQRPLTKESIYYYDFNLNAIQSRDVYIGGWRYSDAYTVFDKRVKLHGPIIYIIDINNKYRNVAKLEKLLKEIRDYFDSLLNTPQGFTIHFKIIVGDAKTEMYYYNNSTFNNLCENSVMNEIDLLNLNVLHEVFAGVNLIR